MAEISAYAGREPMVRTVAMPGEANPNGDIFGGWVLCQMDIAGGVAAGRVARGRTTTVAVEAMTFHKPIEIGDLVSVYAEVERIGRTSITVKVETVATRQDSAVEVTVTEGTFIYVAIDDAGRPRPVVS
jgi:acyl-CoA thioesterase YciA